MRRQTLSLQLAAMKRLTAQKYDIILSGLNTIAIEFSIVCHMQ
jgi:hypothetical protein